MHHSLSIIVRVGCLQGTICYDMASGAMYGLETINGSTENESDCIVYIHLQYSIRSAHNSLSEFYLADYN